MPPVSGAAGSIPSLPPGYPATEQGLYPTCAPQVKGPRASLLRRRSLCYGKVRVIRPPGSC